MRVQDLILRLRKEKENKLSKKKKPTHSIYPPKQTLLSK